MSGDTTRYSLDLTRNPAGVLFGQGRVLTDADLGELVELLERRLRTGTLDAEGRLLFSPQTPDAFMLSLVGGQLAIGPGRAYVDGLQAECFGAPPDAYDDVAESASGTAPVLYVDQPYLSERFPALPGAGTHLVYLDVWHREQGFWNEPSLVDPAIGFDTSTRIQTVWQVRVLGDDQPGLDCDTPDDQVTGWAAATQPSAGRLTTGAVGVPSSDDPCIVPPSGGYRGVENRHYRVEVHDPGPLGTATFKWSRDNASIIVPAVGINAARNQLTVTRTGRDQTLRFSIDDWVEITDEHRELAGEPGELRRVTAVDDVAQTLTLAAPALPADIDPADAERRTRVIRWDQKGDVLDPNGVKVDDVDTNNGVIVVPAVTGAPLILEDGVQVQFSVDAAVGADFRTGDAWCFAARTADASVQVLTAAAPRAVHHHYARLGVWTVGQDPTNCRPEEPPPVVEEHGCCDCTVCVTPESHATGQLTLQDAIDAIGPEGGKVCVAPGEYDIERTLVIVGKRSLTLTGHGIGTVIRHAGPGPAVLVAIDLEVRILDLAIVSLKAADEPDPQTGAPPDGVVRIMSALWVDLERCLIVDLGALGDAQDEAGTLDGGSFGAEGPPRAAVVLDGLLVNVALRDNLLFARAGVVGWAMIGQDGDGLGSPRHYLLTMDLSLERNLIVASDFGVLLGGDRPDGLMGIALHLLQTRLIANVVLGTRQVGIAMLGAVGGRDDDLTPGKDDPLLDLATDIASRVEIAGNVLSARGVGILIGTSSALVADNELRLGVLQKGEIPVGAIGIGVTRGLDPRGPLGVVVRANRISGPGSRAVAVRDRCVSLRVEENRIDGMTQAGIEADTRLPIRDLLIAGNDLTRVAEIVEQGGVERAGIRVHGCERAEIRENRLAVLGRRVGAESALRGIEVAGVADARICDNVISDLGPEGAFQGEVVGIEAFAPFDRLDVMDNAVRPPELREGGRRSTFFALRIEDSDRKGEGGRIIRVESSGRTFAVSGLRLVPARLVAAIFVPAILIELDPVGDDKELLGPVFSVHGNRLEAAGGEPAVDVRLRRSRGAVNDNHVQLLTPGGTAAVHVVVATLVFDANIVDVRAKVAVELDVGGPFTVLGNITSGPIELNGGPLPAPWDVLNQQ